MADQRLTPDDEEFWFERAADLVIGSHERQTKAADRITSALAWFWTAYTAAALISVGLAEPRVEPVPGSIVAIPAILLFVAYGAATFAALPIRLVYDCRKPRQIKEAHDRVFEIRHNRLRVTYVLAAIAALSVAIVVGMVVSATDQPADSIAMARSGDGTAVTVGGHLPGATKAEITATPADPKAGLPVVRKVVTLDGNDLDATVEVDADATYQVAVAWTADGQTTTAEEELKP